MIPDVFSFDVMAHELLTGKLPFEGASPGAQLVALPSGMNELPSDQEAFAEIAEAIGRHTGAVSREPGRNTRINACAIRYRNRRRADSSARIRYGPTRIE